MKYIHTSENESNIINSFSYRQVAFGSTWKWHCAWKQQINNYGLLGLCKTYTFSSLECQWCMTFAKPSMNWKVQHSNKTHQYMVTHGYLMNVKNNILIGKKSMVFFSLQEVDGTKSSRCWEASWPSLWEKCTTLWGHQWHLMHCIVQLFERASSHKPKS